ncbi:hypothetical protein VNI00_009436 [Paramarasmius palmivorus]|uniref:Uncharacterized protein n=1 Tax=Paramarasmius palmivorus TaxID=297713 RepID=A0AAW0CPV9_9AGAR
MDLLPQLPIDCYYHLLSPDIATAPLPLPPNGKVVHVFPKSTAGVEKYFSRLPPSQLGIGYKDDAWEPRPVDNAWSMPDDPSPKDVYLVISPDPHLKPPNDRHYAIRWVVHNRHGKPAAARCIELISGLGHHHLINWGPLTQCNNLYPADNISVVHLGRFTIEERCHLEAIAWNVPVLLPPDGKYGTRNWVACVLGVACARGLMNVDVVRGVLEQAMATELPLSKGPFWRPPAITA